LPQIYGEGAPGPVTNITLKSI